METTHTAHLTMNEFADAVATASPGDQIIYAQGDLACSAIASAELFGVRRVAYRYYEDGRGYLTQRRCPEIKFRGHAAFEYIFTAASTRNGIANEIADRGARVLT
jgi:hypothetical protein